MAQEGEGDREECGDCAGTRRLYRSDNALSRKALADCTAPLLAVASCTYSTIRPSCICSPISCIVSVRPSLLHLLTHRVPACCVSEHCLSSPCISRLRHTALEHTASNSSPKYWPTLTLLQRYKSVSLGHILNGEQSG